MPIKISGPVAALALIVACGVPAHAGGGNCAPTPVKCSPAPQPLCPVVQCSPAPQCHPTPSGPKAAVPESGSVSLVAVGAVALLPLGMRALKSRRQAA